MHTRARTCSPRNKLQACDLDAHVPRVIPRVRITSWRIMLPGVAIATLMLATSAFARPDNGETRRDTHTWIQPEAGENQNAGTHQQPAAKDEDEATGPIVDRADLAKAFIRFEIALHQAKPDESRLRTISAEFDRLTSGFFVGNFAGAIRSLSKLTRELETPAAGELSLEERIAESIKVVIEPPVGVQGGTLHVRLGALWPVDIPAGAAPRVRVLLSHPGGAQRIERTLAIKECAPGELLGSFTLDLERENALSGWWSVGVTAGDVGAAGAAGAEPREKTGVREIGRLAILSGGSLDATRTNVHEILDAAAEREGAPLAAIFAARSRAGALRDRPSPLRSIEFLADPLALSDDVEAEVRAIMRGANPYADRRGDWWREVPIGKQPPEKSGIPVRIYAPPRAAGASKTALESAGVPATTQPAPPAPLVIALHGAGGDEHMFMDAYGRGEIKRLADAHGFIVASPATARASSGANFDALLDAITADYAIDPARIYVIGHSMGAMAAARLASTRASRIAAVVCLAGGPIDRDAPATPAEPGAPAPAARRAPMLVIAGSADPIISAASLRSSAERARAAGHTIEYREVQGMGHTLLVGSRLGEAVDWLLTHRGEPR